MIGLDICCIACFEHCLKDFVCLSEFNRKMFFLDFHLLNETLIKKFLEPSQKFFKLRYSSIYKIKSGHVQWKPLIMLSIGLCDPFGKGPSAVFKARQVWNLFGYCYRSVNAISFPWSQSDHIKRLPLYQVTDGQKVKAKNKTSFFSVEITLPDIIVGLICYL